MDAIVDYDNECFWDELTERLAYEGSDPAGGQRQGPGHGL